MKLTYKKANDLKSCYVVTFEYEHGDNDVTTKQSVTLHLEEHGLIEYLTQFKRVCEVIKYSRETVTKVACIDAITRAANHWIPVETDCVYTSLSDYYAMLSIDSIVYFDGDGCKFDVKVDWLGN